MTDVRSRLSYLSALREESSSAADRLQKKKKGKKQQHYGTNDPKSMQGMSPVLCVVVSRRVLFKHASLVPAVGTDKNGGGEEKSVRTQKPTNQTKRKENEKYTCAHKHYAHRA